MNTKTALAVFLAAAIIAGGASRRRVLQAVVPVVGVRPTGPSIVSTSESTSTTSVDEEELVNALEFDDLVTVVSPIEVGELLCDTLVEAEDADFLSFVLLDNERIVAEKTSYFVANGSTFTDGTGRKVWTGTVTDPPQGEDEAVPRTVSMVWGDVCDTETFLLKVTKRSVGEAISIVKTIPCYGSTTHTCLVKVEVEFAEPGEGATASDDVIADGAYTKDNDEESTIEASPTAGSDRPDRQLQNSGDTVVDVMILYSTDALVLLGRISADQMETTIIESIAWANEATANSRVALFFNCVHIGPLPFEETSASTYDNLATLSTNDDVGRLRDATGADLVQMIGEFSTKSCGEGYFWNGNDVLGTSVVRATCLDDYSMAHEFGHNLGCRHNRDSTRHDREYAHGQRYCDGDDPYRTVMSYPCGLETGIPPRVLYFSNPDVDVSGRPTGTATEDNARAIRDNMVSVSNFRNKVSVPAGYKVLGCFQDTSANRVLTGTFEVLDRTMTNEVCAAFCQGARYFGTEYGQECFCGGDTDDPTELGLASCTYSCSGDSSQTCGGFNAITVFETAGTIDTLPRYLGCWTDSTSARLMNVMISEKNMTNERCAELCSSNVYYGTQFGRECWCGDGNTDYTTHGVSTRCTYGCAGDSSQTCGGVKAMRVYEVDAAASPTENLGCWTDSSRGRIMGVVTTNNDMTNDLCEGICRSYAYFGTQYGEECWCGDSSTDFTANGGSTGCNMDCAGGSGAICGGVYAMSVWRFT